MGVIFSADVFLSGKIVRIDIPYVSIQEARDSLGPYERILSCIGTCVSGYEITDVDTQKA